MKLLWMLILVCTLLFTGCDSQRQKAEQDEQIEMETTLSSREEENASQLSSASKEVFAMDTYMTVTAYGEQCQDAVEAAIAEIERLDAILSTGDETSEIAGLNREGQGMLSGDAEALLRRGMELYEDTQGIFNIAVYPLMECWGFTTQQYRIPEDSELGDLLEHLQLETLQVSEDGQVTLTDKGMKIDFGGIAKGYTSARIMDIFKAYDITSGMVNLGGNVQVLGRKTDGSKWRVAVQDPEDSEDYCGVLEVADQAVITSGGYERYFEENGQTYHHIIDPRTGKPAESGLKSVTIVSEDGTLADALSTTMFILGKEQAIAYWEDNREKFDMVLIDENRQIYVTAGIADSFSAKSEVEIIE